LALLADELPERMNIDRSHTPSMTPAAC